MKCLICVVVLLAGLTGCLGVSAFHAREARPAAELPEATYRAADHLHAQLKGSEVSAYPMLAAVFVDSADVEQTTDLGRLLSEQVASRLSQHGYSIVEMQLRAAQLALRPEGGIFALSRDIAQVQADVQGYSILLGTYTIVERQIFVNARILRTSDGVALASSDFSLPYIRSRPAAPSSKAQSGDAEPSVQTAL